MPRYFDECMGHAQTLMSKTLKHIAIGFIGKTLRGKGWQGKTLMEHTEILMIP